MRFATLAMASPVQLGAMSDRARASPSGHGRVHQRATAELAGQLRKRQRQPELLLYERLVGRNQLSQSRSSVPMPADARSAAIAPLDRPCPFGRSVRSCLVFTAEDFASPRRSVFFGMYGGYLVREVRLMRIALLVPRVPLHGRLGMPAD
jgi:hypothetical protein